MVPSPEGVIPHTHLELDDAGQHTVKECPDRDCLGRLKHAGPIPPLPDSCPYTQCSRHEQVKHAAPIPPWNPPPNRQEGWGDSTAVGKVEDFKGAIDGRGYKEVMDVPKMPLQLIAPEVLEAMAEVLQYGAKKYAPNNWMRGISWTTVFGAVLRHLWAWFRGEDIDPESGLPHLSHAACGLMFLTYYTRRPQYSNLDDRVFKQEA